MYAFIKGILATKTPTYVVVDNNGVGYHILITLNTYAVIKGLQETTLHTVLIVREDAQLLYGFATEQEREVFNKLVAVSGIGPSTAIVILSNLTADELRKMIIQGNTTALTKIKGIGAKTAQRLVLELKDKMQKVSGDTLSVAGIPVANMPEDAASEAVAALVMLGYSKSTAEQAILKIKIGQEGQNVEQLIRQALKIM